MNIKESKLWRGARKVYHGLRNWDRTWEDWTVYRDMGRLKDIHRGEACVVVGNGPSLNAGDLTRLHELGIPTFACNRIHLIFPQTPWRPTYYLMSDEKLIRQYDDNLPDVQPENRFFPKQYRNRIRNGRFYNTIPFDYEHEGRFSLDAARGICPGASVTTEMIQLACYMGFREIYLIGVDFSYTVTRKVDSGSYAYQGENNYFIPGYLKPGEVADIPNVNANLLAFHAARDALEAQGRIIRNATRGGKLEVFQRVSLDTLLAEWEGQSI